MELSLVLFWVFVTVVCSFFFFFFFILFFLSFYFLLVSPLSYLYIQNLNALLQLQLQTLNVSSVNNSSRMLPILNNFLLTSLHSHRSTVCETECKRVWPQSDCKFICGVSVVLLYSIFFFFFSFSFLFFSFLFSTQSRHHSSPFNFK
jgi:hypothetical protein